MHDDKGVPLGILIIDAFGRPNADSIHYVNMCNSMPMGMQLVCFVLVSTYVEKSF